MAEVITRPAEAMVTNENPVPQDSSKTSRAGSTKSPNHLPSPQW